MILTISVFKLLPPVVRTNRVHIIDLYSIDIMVNTSLSIRTFFSGNWIKILYKLPKELKILADQNIFKVVFNLLVSHSFYSADEFLNFKLS